MGQAAAAAILDMRAEDGAVGPFLNFACPQETNPGSINAHRVRRSSPLRCGKTSPPSSCRHSSQFRPGPPYAVTTKKYTADFNEVKSLGGDDVTTPSARTADQTQIALFWYESSPLKWNRIARTVSAGQGLTCGRTPGYSGCSTWRSRTATSPWSIPRTITTTGDRSPLFGRRTRTTIQTRPPTRRGHP